VKRDSEAAPTDTVETLKDLFFSVCPTLKISMSARGSFDIQLDKISPYKDEGRGDCSRF
jgi:ribonuclease R